MGSKYQQEHSVIFSPVEKMTFYPETRKRELYTRNIVIPKDFRRCAFR